MKHEEKAVQLEIVQRLNFLGHACWLNELSLMPTYGGFRKPANARTADIIGCLRGGRMLAIECKREEYRDVVTLMWQQTLAGNFRGRMSFRLKSDKETKRALEQADNLKWLRDHGAWTMFAFSWRDVEGKLLEDTQ